MPQGNVAMFREDGCKLQIPTAVKLLFKCGGKIKYIFKFSKSIYILVQGIVKYKPLQEKENINQIQL